jgi:hypothetical protein
MAAAFARMRGAWGSAILGPLFSILDSYQSGLHFSIGAPIKLPYSVQLPS